ncbi:CRISPR-associated helicase Cas3' [Paenibacillus thermoaerophilus]|uniref:CRISPR-associated helicase Cas3 n=1 Tax=Paenibacillus thermoaerophilus TaxID=1215385 RepID=A0ABW2UY53_9BACL|nr:CRISPR-associated helicase Cas3' [Paenibacillus thermoaerophilus]TMV08115.1 CRISPR-associated helicase Cas3' [Paenibacillus thermoaerophilus]
MYYAHRTDSSDKSGWQKLTDHLQNVSAKTSEFASVFGAGKWGAIAGLLHDAGKFSKAFQRRLNGSPEPVDHATAGAQYIDKAWNQAKIARILAYIIAGHHAGLADFGSDASDERTLSRRLLKSVEPFKEALEEHLKIGPLYPLPLPIKPGVDPGLQLSLFTRMLFSCLIDADSIDTELYADRSRAELRGNTPLLVDLFDRYRHYMENRFANPEGFINIIRSELLTECLSKADAAPGLFTLTLPTGSGKTLISLGFALRHAVRHNLRRIVYVIPYTSIIEQNARVFREAVGADTVLEHHSNVQHEIEEDLEEADELYKWKKKRMLAEENWDYPIIVTTNVQFFESLFANKRSRCRKLHNLANSVIILDEAQMMNGELLKPSLYALEELSRNYGATIVFSTATQPNLQALFPKPVKIEEIVADVPKRFEQFKRVRLESMGLTNYDRIAELMSGDPQALCIVNTRKAARELFEKMRLLVAPEALFHLSARMCPRHREAKLKEIRGRLERDLPCVLISTQLIECGVDVDFPIVYRELAGLDSIAQAAGRCNRNGNRPVCTVFVFETDETPRQGWFGITAGAAQTILRRYPEDPLSLAAIGDYFKELYFYQTLAQDKTDKHNILGLLNEQVREFAFPFETVAQRFQLIETAAKPVIVEYDEAAREALEALRHADRIGTILRKLQPYVVQLYPQEFAAFRHAGEILEVRENVFALSSPERWYDREIGVKPFTQENHLQEIYIF